MLGVQTGHGINMWFGLWVADLGFGVVVRYQGRCVGGLPDNVVTWDIGVSDSPPSSVV